MLHILSHLALGGAALFAVRMIAEAIANPAVRAALKGEAK